MASGLGLFRDGLRGWGGDGGGVCCGGGYYDDDSDGCVAEAVTFKVVAIGNMVRRMGC